MTTTSACESCGMPIETGRYCGYCTDETGQLQSFDERFERMTAWQARRNPGHSQEEIERQTLDYMASMPAWRDHPRVSGAGHGPGRRPGATRRSRPSRRRRRGGRRSRSVDFRFFSALQSHSALAPLPRVTGYGSLPSTRRFDWRLR